jgi:uncharacterized protein (UPF0335 family)
MSEATAEMFAPGEIAPDVTEPQTLTRSAQEVLRRLIERIERVNGEIDDLAADRKEIFAEAKSTGFDTKAIRKVIALRKLDRAERAEMEQIVDLYLHVLGDA